MMEFTKMHGAGNDYVYVDARAMPERDWGSLSRSISDRHFGVGGDGLILVMNSEVADLRMRMFNSDGSEGAMCGNGIRCFAKYAIERGIVPSTAQEVTVDTMSGVRTIVPHYDGTSVDSARVSMGPPRLAPAEIPVDLDPAIAGKDGPIINYAIHPGDFRLFLTFVSMGNPHAVTFIDQPVEEFPLHNIGPLVERHPIFPTGSTLKSSTCAMMATWTLASGSAVPARPWPAAPALAPSGSPRGCWDTPATEWQSTCPAAPSISNGMARERCTWKVPQPKFSVECGQNEQLRNRPQHL